MPITKTILPGQTVIDIAMQYLGDAERVDEICTLNGMDLGIDLVAGESILIPDAVDRDKKAIVNNFTNRNNAPASALLVAELDESDWDVYYGLFD